jgi:putative hemolysin
METVTYAAVVLVCLVLSAFFSSSETALLRLRAQDLEVDIKAHRGPAALAVRDLLDSTSRLLVTILLGNNLVNIAAASFAAALSVRYLGEEWGVLVAALSTTAIVFLFCEVLPKAVAARHPRRIAYTVALPLYLLHQLLRPLHLLYDRVVEPFVKSIAGGAERTPMSAAEEVMRLARAVPGAGTTGTPLAIIGAVSSAAEMTVKDIMVPRTEIVAFQADTPPSKLLDELLDERYTRAPIYEESIDNVSGVVHLKDLVELVRRGQGDLRSVLKPVLRVPERTPILSLLSDMQRAFVHMALVKDEFGVTLGLVTQEDILEELVGEIRDEFDREELLIIRQLNDTTYEALGRVTVLDFNRQTGWKLEAERGDTLAGLVFNKLGRAPRKGESVRIPGYEIEVADVSGARVTQVRVIRHPDEEAAGPASSAVV